MGLVFSRRDPPINAADVITGLVSTSFSKVDATTFYLGELFNQVAEFFLISFGKESFIQCQYELVNG